MTYLSHEAIGARALVVSEDDVGIVVGHQLLETAVIAGDTTFAQATGAQGVLGDVGNVLLEDERRQTAVVVP